MHRSQDDERRMMLTRCRKAVRTSIIVGCGLWFGLQLYYLTDSRLEAVDHIESPLPIGVVDFGRIRKEFEDIVVKLHGDEGLLKIISLFGDDEKMKAKIQIQLDALVAHHFKTATGRVAKRRRLEMVVNVYDPDLPRHDLDISHVPIFRPGYIVFKSNRIDITDDVCVEFAKEMTREILRIIEP